MKKHGCRPFGLFGVSSVADSSKEGSCSNLRAVKLWPSSMCSAEPVSATWEHFQ
jgi:hypothetical protein